MEIKTKFSIGDTAYFIDKNQITCCKIKDIRIEVKRYDVNPVAYIQTHTKYKLENITACKIEELLFSTRKELVESLLEEEDVL